MIAERIYFMAGPTDYLLNWAMSQGSVPRYKAMEIEETLQTSLGTGDTLKYRWVNSTTGETVTFGTTRKKPLP